MTDWRFTTNIWCSGIPGHIDWCQCW